RLSASGIRNHDLTAAEEGIKLAGAKYRLIAIGARHDDNLMQDVIFGGRVRDDPADWGFIQEVPLKHPGECFSDNRSRGKIGDVLLRREKLFEVVQIKDGSLRHLARHREMLRHPSRARTMQRNGADAGQEQGGGQGARHLSKHIDGSRVELSAWF